MEDWVTIRNLKRKNPLMGTRKIADLLGVSRNTVKRALNQEAYKGYERQGTVNLLIEPFAVVIKERYLDRGEKVSAIIKALRSKGYEGSDIAIYRYIERTLKEERRRANFRPYQPYETVAGEQMQYDWSDFSVCLGERLVKMYVHLLIFGFSRQKVFGASLSITQSDVFEALEEAFSEAGGVCKRIQTDNAKVFVDNPSKDNFRWNRRYLDFCGFYGIKPTRSLPGHPWSKGKVEKPFDHLKTHFISGGCFSSFGDFFGKLKAYQAEVNGSVHSVTKKTPLELFEEERGHLLELAKDPVTGKVKRYIGYKEEFRKVNADCLISFGGNRYSVPHRYVRSEVWVRVSKGVELKIYSAKNDLIATHPLSTGKGEVILCREHYRGYRSEAEYENFSLSAKRLKDRFGETYGKVEQFIDAVKAQKKTNPAYHLFRIARVFQDYPEDDCIFAMETCFRYNTFSSPFVQGCIRANGMVKTDLEREHALSPILPGDVPRGNVKRSLSEYRL